MDGSAALFQPPNPADSETLRFLATVNDEHSLELTDYNDLYNWSINHIDLFWSAVWDHTHIVGKKGSHVVDPAAQPADNPPWFSDARLNWAENMMQCRSPCRVALIQPTEPTATHPFPPIRTFSYAELYSTVANLVSAFTLHGLKPGDRVASYASNCIENVAACLATTALGGIWVSAAADFGPQGVLERFEQVQPKFIFSVDQVVYNAKVHAHIPKLAALVSGLEGKGISPSKVVVIHPTPHLEPCGDRWPKWVLWDDFVEEGRESGLGRTASGEIEWYRSSFDLPLWILFSSGTTGRPKPIVHRAGGMLLQAKKELGICADIRPEDVFFYYTTTGWMMWNFLVSGLSLGCALVLYDGSPLRDPSFLWRLVDELGISIFGTSAKYLDSLSKCYRPRENHHLGSLRHIYSTGSPLSPSLFDYVYEHVAQNVLLGSITGGTDICSLFAGVCSALPVYRGELQCCMLGMAIESFSSDGKPTERDEAGELVCVKPFPCMPLGFWPLSGFGTEVDVEAAKTRFWEAYFSEFPGVWYHGDHVVITRSRAGNGGGVVMLGRSDGVLNPGGVRFGSAELYDVLDSCFGAEHLIVDCIAIGQKINHGTDERVILFVKLPQGEKLSPELEQRIKSEIRNWKSPRHVPARIIQVDEIPYTLNNKRVEVLVKKIVNGAPLTSVNPATLSNPECLELYAEIGAGLRAEIA